MLPSVTFYATINVTQRRNLEEEEEGNKEREKREKVKKDTSKNAALHTSERTTSDKIDHGGKRGIGQGMRAWTLFKVQNLK
jgi:hypothetical protein